MTKLRRNFQNIIGLDEQQARRWGLPPDAFLEIFTEQPGSSLGAAPGSVLSHQALTFINYVIIGLRLVRLDTANNRFSPLEGCNVSVSSRGYQFPNPLGVDSAMLFGTPEQPFVPFGPVEQRDKNVDDSPTFTITRTVAAVGPESVQWMFAAYKAGGV